VGAKGALAARGVSAAALGAANVVYQADLALLPATDERTRTAMLRCPPHTGTL
jgi:hypothetical protein